MFKDAAAKAYGEAFTKKAEPALLYAQGMAELSAGKVIEAKQHLNAYLRSSGPLEFKASAPPFPPPPTSRAVLLNKEKRNLSSRGSERLLMSSI